MANYATLKAAVSEVINTNGNNEITGAILQQVLLSIINSLGADFQFAGVAKRTTNPGTPDQRVYYLASEVGAYPNFGLTVPASGIYVFVWESAWTMERVTTMSSDLEIGVVNEDGLFLVDRELNVGVRVDSDGLTANNMLTIQPL